ncbi:MAG: hypothetical protein ACI9EF_003158 [Pseudohongiellaceae bacterium]|jgi:hypothetical protein
MKHLTHSPASAAALLGALVLGPSLTAQSPSPAATWVPLNSSALPGTPAEILLDGTDSTATDSFFDVFVHGC